ncbi:bifunctional 4-hydroxy-2-oxoglutarate aldolase/2-dehydro-3-deoxy-phosphogluconate aldolase [Pseudobacteriovorax antillogorgiicola]
MEELLKKSPVIPVLTINSIHEAVPLARALVRGGLSILEVTLRTDCAYDAIEKIREEVPEAVVGGGTVTTVEHLEKLTAVGAHFAVSPGITPELLKKARDLGMPYLPGITSVSELMTGLNEGYEVFKFFPAAASGGVKALKSFSGPFSQVRFCPTGGINRENYQNYLSLPNTLCVGGSWVAPKDAIANENWEVIENLSRDAVTAAGK